MRLPISPPGPGCVRCILSANHVPWAICSCTNADFGRASVSAAQRNPSGVVLYSTCQRRCPKAGCWRREIGRLLGCLVGMFAGQGTHISLVQQNIRQGGVLADSTPQLKPPDRLTRSYPAFSAKAHGRTTSCRFWLTCHLFSMRSVRYLFFPSMDFLWGRPCRNTRLHTRVQPS